MHVYVHIIHLLMVDPPLLKEIITIVLETSFLRQLSRLVALSFLYSLLCAVAHVFSGMHTGGIAINDIMQCGQMKTRLRNVHGRRRRVFFRYRPACP